MGNKKGDSSPYRFSLESIPELANKMTGTQKNILDMVWNTHVLYRYSMARIKAFGIPKRIVLITILQNKKRRNISYLPAC